MQVISTNEYIFTIEQHSTLKTVITPFWKKILDAYNILLPARPHQGQLGGPGREILDGWGWWAGPERMLDLTFRTFTVVYLSYSVEQEHLCSISNVYSLISTFECLFGSNKQNCRLYKKEDPNQTELALWKQNTIT